MTPRVEIERAKARAMPSNAMMFQALAKARGEFPEIPKTRKATIRSAKANYSYMYADLADIFRAVTEPMAAHGLGIWQDITEKGVVTTIYHESGETRVSEPWPIKPMRGGAIDDAQGLQAATQVAKRYSLQAALGISTEESHEGDRSRDLSQAPPSMSHASSQGLKDAWVDGVLDSLPDDASDRQKAEAFANQLIQDFDKPKSVAGINSAWNKRERIIDALEAKHNDLFQSVFDAFHNRRDEMKGNDE